MSSTSIPQGHQPGATNFADEYYAKLMQNTSNYADTLPQMTLPQGYDFAQNIIRNPYGQQQQQGANTASGIAMNSVAPTEFGGMSALSGMASQAPGMAGQIQQTAFDPQNALYAREYQRNMDNTNAINSMYGLGNSPYGAGLANDSSRNFNIDWQNQQLQRQIAGAGAYGGLMGAAGGAYGQAGALGGMGLDTYTQGANLPYQTYAGQQMAGMDALMGYAGLTGSALQPDAGLAQEAGNYMKLDQGATALAQNAINMENQADAQAFQGIGNLFGNFFKAAAMGGGGGG